MMNLGTISGIKQRRFDTIDRAMIAAKSAIQAEEDRNVFDAIARAMVPAGSVWVKGEEFVCRVFRRDMPITMEVLLDMETWR
jgi:hypothetical protein